VTVISSDAAKHDALVSLDTCDAISQDQHRDDDEQVSNASDDIMDMDDVPLLLSTSET
jgi:hypothetical protein